MRKKTLSLLFAVIMLAILTASWLIPNPKHAYAQSSSAINVNVDHLIIVRSGGQVTINDTVQLSAKEGETASPISSFNVGFPYKYGFQLDQVFAYESLTPSNKLTLDLDYGLDEVGFYAVRVNLGKEIDLNTVESFNFTVVFVFSGLVTEKEQNGQIMLELDFPVYPSLAQEAQSSKTTLILPQSTNFTRTRYLFNKTAVVGTLILEKKPLEALAFEPTILSFNTIETFYLLDADKVRREVVIDQGRELLISDYYSLTNRAIHEISFLKINVPLDAYDATAQDDLGNALTVTLEKRGVFTVASITLKSALKRNQTINLQVTFKLPLRNTVEQNGWSSFNLRLRMFEPINMTLRKLTVTINLPEGAKFQSSNAAEKPSVEYSGAYQEKPVFVLNNVTSFQNLDLAVSYSHAVFWAGFRPTLWTASIVLVIGAFVFLWQFRKAPTLITTALPIRTEELQNYVKAYEEERKLLHERESLEAQARKGKIPRRLYKVRSKTLESRLSVLSRDLTNLREKIRVAGPRYSDLMRQVEVAETELQGVEADIKRTEVRYRRGEISAAAYHKLLEDSYRRRDRARTNIDGVLLRLREEID